MQDIIVVLGPWSSGTSAAIGTLEIMGCNTCPPHFGTSDSRTPNSFESLSLRNIIMPNFHESRLQFIGPDRTAIAGLLRDWLARESMRSNKPAAVKLPHLCFFIPEMIAAWNPIFILVERPLDEIENSRARRNWAPQYGASGAKIAYGTSRRDLLKMNQAFLTVSYAGLTRNSEHTIDQMARWAGLSPDAETRKKAAKFVIR